jgi:hypothetical protein
MKAPERVYHTMRSRTEWVREGHPDAAFLAFPKGEELPHPVADALGFERRAQYPHLACPAPGCAFVGADKGELRGHREQMEGTANH